MSETEGWWIFCKVAKNEWHRWQLHIGSVDRLLSSRNRPLTEPILIQISPYGINRPHWIHWVYSVGSHSPEVCTKLILPVLLKVRFLVNHHAKYLHRRITKTKPCPIQLAVNLTSSNTMQWTLNQNTTDLPRKFSSCLCSSVCWNKLALHFFKTRST